ncbi:MAG: alpha/beta hydrolase [Mariprofundaceae bacterium]|nr:alpha/beta hydrolase [Mariprofundaceae bacterium]
MFEDRYIYFPEKEVLYTPSSVGLEFSTVRPVTRDGVTLHGWYIPHPAARHTVLHFHGNAGNISHRLHLYARWHRMGLAVFAVDYRGYGQSGGAPSEDGLYGDARASWQYLTGKLHVPAKRIILAGRSLGCTVASQLAIEVNAAGLVLETPFTSAPDLARTFYPWLPVGFLMRTRLDTLAKMRQTRLPLLVIRAGEDEIVPAGMAEEIFSAAHEPKMFVILPGGHNGFDGVSEEAYLAAWHKWLVTLPK